MYNIVYLFILLFFTTGCFVNESDYKSEANFRLQENLNQHNAKHLNNESIKNDWWRQFEDDTLNYLIEKASLNNKDVQIAKNNIIRSRIAVKMIAAGFFPEINGNISNIKIDADQFAGSGLDADLFISGFDAKWELDVFGKKIDETSAAKLRSLSVFENYNKILLSLNSDIVKSYFQLKKLQHLLKNQNKKIEINKKIVSKIKEVFKIGHESESSLLEAKKKLQYEECSINEIEFEIKKLILQIAILCDMQPEHVDRKITSNVKDIKSYNVEVVPIGLKSDLLKRRPDIMIADYELQAKVKELKLASKNFLPSFSITGLFGVANSNRKVFEGSSSYFALSSVKFPIFQAGKLVQQYKDAKINAQIGILEYENVVINALKDTQIALMKYLNNLNNEERIKDALRLTERIHFLNKCKNKEGELDYINYLNSELLKIDAENKFLKAKESTLLSIVSLHKELGGKFNLDIQYEK